MTEKDKDFDKMNVGFCLSIATQMSMLIRYCRMLEHREKGQGVEAYNEIIEQAHIKPTDHDLIIKDIESYYDKKTSSW